MTRRASCVLTLTLGPAAPADALSAFAHRYGLACVTCHDPVPNGGFVTAF